MSDPFAHNPDLVACADLVRRGDPDRFMATMAAPVAVRAVLFPIYACNLEAARAPWVSTEPLIAQMRLQWWLDALDEIASGGVVRRHEVVTSLALVLPPQAAAALRRSVEARIRDADPAPFEDEAEMLAYLEATAGGVAEAACLALGRAVPQALQGWSRAAGLVRYFQAVPELVARGRHPLPDGRAQTVSRLAREAKAGLGGLRALRREAGPAVFEFWQVAALLRRAARHPGQVADGQLTLSEFSRRGRLLALTL